MKKKITTILFLLIAGSCIYWMLSPNIYLFKLMGIKNQNGEITTGLTMVIRNFLPDILWAIAINLTAVVMQEKKFPAFYIYSLIILPFLSEVLQYIGFMPGTFDWYDLIIYTAIYLSFFNPKFKRLCKANSKILSAQ